MGKYPVCKINKSKQDNDCYYIIRRIGDSGFFSNYLYVLGHINYARKKGYIPVVDMLNYPTVYDEKETVNGTFNNWEYYFEQPDGHTLREAYNAPKTILSDNFYLSDYTIQYVGGSTKIPDRATVENLNALINKNICLRKEVSNEIENVWESLIGVADAKVLGVHIRGTDMNACKDHPEAIDVEEFVKVVEKMNAEKSFTHILVCTDEKLILERLVSVFGDKVVSTNAYRAETATNVGIHLNSDYPRDNHKYFLGLEVLTDAVLLSKCNSLICGNSNVSLAAILFNNNKYTEIKHLTK